MNLLRMRWHPACLCACTASVLAQSNFSLQCAQVNAHVWAAAAAESTTAAVATAPQHQPADDGLDDLIDLVGSPEAAAAAAQALCAAKQPAGAAAAATATAKHSAQQAVQQCSELAVLLRQLHGALVDGKLPAQAADDRSKDGSRLQGGSSGSSKAANGQQHREGVGPKQETGRQGTMDEGAPAAGSDRRRGRSARQQSNPEGPPAKRTKTWQQQNPAPWAGKKGGPAAGTGYGGTGEPLRPCIRRCAALHPPRPACSLRIRPDSAAVPVLPPATRCCYGAGKRMLLSRSCMLMPTAAPWS